MKNNGFSHPCWISEINKDAKLQSDDHEACDG